MKDTISETELYALKGLRWAAQKRRNQLNDIEEMVAEILGDEDGDWALELTYNHDDTSIEEFLGALKIGVTYA